MRACHTMYGSRSACWLRLTVRAGREVASLGQPVFILSIEFHIGKSGRVVQIPEVGSSFFIFRCPVSILVGLAEATGAPTSEVGECQSCQAGFRFHVEFDHESADLILPVSDSEHRLLQ